MHKGNNDYKEGACNSILGAALTEEAVGPFWLLWY